jgi:hypothetical protein
MAGAGEGDDELAPRSHHPAQLRRRPRREDGDRGADACRRQWHPGFDVGNDELNPGVPPRRVVGGGLGEIEAEGAGRVVFLAQPCGGRGEVVPGAGAELDQRAAGTCHRRGDRVRDRSVVAGGEELGPGRHHRRGVTDPA